MADDYTETTRTSWGKRIVASFMGIIVGILLFIGSFPVIFWNEGRSVDRIKTLNEGRGLVVAVSSETLDPANNSALIHTSGKAMTNDVLQDSVFGVEETALKLQRTVEMFQWKENKSTTTETNLGGSETTKTTYSYDTTWSDNLIDSAVFKKRDGHTNPSSMPYESQTFVASPIHVGAFTLTKPFVSQINEFESYTLSQKHLDALNESLKKSFVLSGNEFFKGNPAAPKVGDVRVKFGIINPTQISVVGKQNNDKIETYFTKHGNIDLLEMGTVAADAMFASAESENTLITWLIRVGAFTLMWVGLAMVLGPIKVLGDVVPFIGSILGAGTGLVTGIVALILSIITTAIAWIIFRPLIGIALLLVACAFFFGGFKMIKARLQKKA